MEVKNLTRLTELGRWKSRWRDNSVTVSHGLSNLGIATCEPQTNIAKQPLNVLQCITFASTI